MINKLQHFILDLEQRTNFNKLSLYYKNNTYLYVFIKQLQQLLSNAKSIDVLLKIDNVEDAYCIYRKFLETFFILMAVNEKPDCCDDFLKHNEYLSHKVMNNDKTLIKALVNQNIPGYIEYGYLVKYITPRPIKITMYDVANVGKTSKYFKQYKICNNFVHNNLNLLQYDKSKAKDELISALDDIIKYIINRISKIL